MLHEHRKYEVNFYEKIDIKFSRHVLLVYSSNKSCKSCNSLVCNNNQISIQMLCDHIIFVKIRYYMHNSTEKFSETKIFLDQIKSSVKCYSKIFPKIHRKTSV